MKQIPLKHYRAPQYPELNRANEAAVKVLLKKRMPARWKRLAASAAMLCASAGLMEGCARESPRANPTEQGDEKLQKKEVPAPKNTVVVAPLAPEAKEYGYGSFGCVAVSPPVYLSEGEAAAVVVEEMEKAGFAMRKNGVLTRKKDSAIARPENPDRQTGYHKNPPVRFTQTDKIATAAPYGHPGFQEEEVIKLPTDWIVPEKGIALELITRGDEKFWRDVETIRLDPGFAWGEISYAMTTAGRTKLYDAAVTARETYALFEWTRPLKMGIVVSPITYPETRRDWSEEGKNKAKEKCREILREQVRQFVKWLEEQEK